MCIVCESLTPGETLAASRYVLLHPEEFGLDIDKSDPDFGKWVIKDRGAYLEAISRYEREHALPDPDEGPDDTM